MGLTLCVLLWPHPGKESALVSYEDRVLDYVADHGGRVLQRVRNNGSAEQPYEIQIIEFPSPDAFDQYMNDPRRTALLGARDTSVARTELMHVEVVTSRQAAGREEDRT